MWHEAQDTADGARGTETTSAASPGSQLMPALPDAGYKILAVTAWPRRYGIGSNVSAGSVGRASAATRPGRP
jgi:hypothetical protein